MRNETTNQYSNEERRTGGNGFDRRLMRLDEMSGYKVSSDDPDVRNWPVETRDGTSIGKVASLIIDTTELKARYVEIDLDKSALGLKESRRVTLPIGNAKADDSRDVITLPEHSPRELAALPAFTGTLSREDELGMRRRFDEGYTGDSEDDLYAHANYDQSRFFGKRRHGREDREYLATDATLRSDASNARRH